MGEKGKQAQIAIKIAFLAFFLMNSLATRGEHLVARQEEFQTAKLLISLQQQGVNNSVKGKITEVTIEKEDVMRNGKILYLAENRIYEGARLE